MGKPTYKIMKKIFLFLFAGLMAHATSAQIQAPQPSPSATVQQEVGLTTVELNYSRPGMRGRTIFGGLVPYNERWVQVRTTIPPFRSTLK